MPKIGAVSASLWNLRTVCEHELRLLTDAQRLIDQYRDQPKHQQLLKGRLQADLANLLRTNATLREATQGCVDAVNELPVEASTVGAGLATATGATSPR